MARTIRPIANTVVAAPVIKEQQTKSGLFIPQNTAQELETKVATVIAVGQAVERIKVGETILYKPYATFDVKLDNQTFVIVEDEDILAVVEDGQEPA